MIIVWGSKLYGKVNEIEGVGHVATLFGHLFWIPLIPLKSYFVTRDGRHNFDGMELGVDSKSVLVGYGRVFSVLLLLAGLGAINSLFNPHEILNAQQARNAKIMVGLGVMAIPVCIACYLRSVRYASYETATKLAHTLGLDDRLCTYIEFYYGKISEEEADRRMDDIEAAENGERTEWHGDEELTAIYQRYMAG